MSDHYTNTWTCPFECNTMITRQKRQEKVTIERIQHLLRSLVSLACLPTAPSPSQAKRNWERWVHGFRSPAPPANINAMHVILKAGGSPQGVHAIQHEKRRWKERSGWLDETTFADGRPRVMLGREREHCVAMHW
jgi:hypothetical protein